MHTVYCIQVLEEYLLQFLEIILKITKQSSPLNTHAYGEIVL